MQNPALTSIPLSLYVHIPWCVKKCPYCDFNSHEKNDSFDEDKYVEALIKDFDAEYEFCQQRDLSSIFFGGGTPSLFSADAIHTIIAHVKKRFKFSNIEISMEANPGTFEQVKFNDFNSAGINRLSIGIQSFNQTHLETLGRIHDSKQALKAIDTAKAAGFNNINLDLMFGLPSQTIEQAVDDIEMACKFDVTHLSHYQLTIEENTYFHKHTPVLPELDLIWEMQTQCQNILVDYDYQQYEISAYAKKDKRCSHNLNYWKFGDYIGIGAGAHGKITYNNPDPEFENKIEIKRSWKHRQPQQYMQKALVESAVSGSQVLAQQDIIFEFLLNALRLKTGSDIQNYENTTGKDIESLRTAIANIDTSLLVLNENKVSTTEKGFLFLNEVLENLL